MGLWCVVWWCSARCLIWNGEWWWCWTGYRSPVKPRMIRFPLTLLCVILTLFFLSGLPWPISSFLISWRLVAAGLKFQPIIFSLIMNSTTNRAITRARASPRSDETAISRARASPVSDEPQDGENTRAFPRSDENVIRAPPQAPRMRISTWNVGSMTGRSTELGKVLQRRRINICCIQETKWKGSKSRNIGCGYKLIYHGTRAQNGVGIVVDRDLQERVVEVERVTERLMSIKFALDNQCCMNVISAYAPQAGCTNAEKDTFWEEINDLLCAIPSNENTYVCGDLNGHVGQTTTVYNRIHGNYGYGKVNTEGEKILEFASAHNLALIN
ncbi:craniofacial development protein 2-like [Nilaparvata lugens]|uniref:craniofacial development protein 2-like n=1 Tax=Nilaparvata lugens TaxID=108931 RepID=UPI00193CDC2B|nr:craniofacial development protein 2-like [Nilaparvata lugens]